MSTVLVTGGTGFVASHIIKQLRERNHAVITTVRSAAKGDALLAAHARTAPSSTGTLNYVVVPDISAPHAFDKALQTAPPLTAAIHTASPFHYDTSDPVANFLRPAVEGTTSFLAALHAHSPSCKRVVLLSSFAAVRNDASPPKNGYDEASWNPVTWDEASREPRKAYQGSKTLAERAAWEFVKREKPAFDLVTICPSLVFGPVALQLTKEDLPGGLNTSNQRIYQMMVGEMKGGLAPTGFYSFVDVRDVADAHVAAVERKEAEGRCLMIAGYFSNKEIAEVLAGMGEEYTAVLPDLGKEEVDLPPLNERYKWNCHRSEDVFGVKYRSLEETVRDTVLSLKKIM